MLPFKKNVPYLSLGFPVEPSSTGELTFHMIPTESTPHLRMISKQLITVGYITFKCLLCFKIYVSQLVICLFLISLKEAITGEKAEINSDPILIATVL